MTDVLSITAPIYLLIGLGYVAGRARLFAAAELRVLGRFVLMFSMPALLFDAVSRRRLAEVLDPVYMTAYAVASVTLLLGGLAWARWRRGAPMSLAALQGLGMCSSNSGYVGYPVLQQLLGPAAGSVLALTVLVENLVVIPLGIALADAGGHGSVRRALVQAFANLWRNPLVVAIVAGLVFALFGLELPGPVQRTVSILAAAAAPVALFVIGGTLVGLQLEGVRGDLVRVVLGKLVLHPLAVLGMLWLLPPLPAHLHLGAVVLAAMPMMGIYPVLAQKHHHERFCAAALLAATVASFFTLSAGLWWLKRHPELFGA
ncbi:MAG: AEC family transporter [Betaproteobacteria bacterium]|nr:AEC family transporter [Betaproteobacteria bacterium]MCC6247478.1 AEC family transporter [Rubrivivax sp.]